MGINNRSFDPSEQREVKTAAIGAVTNAGVYQAYVCPRPQLVEQIKVGSLGISGAPTVNLQVQRFITGTGATLIGALTATLTLAALGTSGLQTVTYQASLVLAAGDVLHLTGGGGSGAAMADVTVTTVVKNLQDIKTNFGTSY